MNLNVGIVDQRIAGILADSGDLLPPGYDESKRKSAAFVLLCMSTVLDLGLEEAAKLLTEGGNDAGVDGIFFGEPEDSEFPVVLFQGKYKVKALDGEANFPENGVEKAIDTVATLFDPAKPITLNPLLAPKIEEIRSLVRDGYIPNVRVVLCNNGARWTSQADQRIENAGFGEQVHWSHWNHDNIVAVMQKKKAVDDSLRLTGKALVEEYDFRRVLIGKAPVTEIAELFNRHGDLLLERNIRRFLGLHSNRVNQAMSRTLRQPKTRNNFYFFNNGITMICRKFRHNALQGENFQVKLEGLQIINGGQTCRTIQETLRANVSGSLDDTHVLVRIYELAAEDDTFVRDITYATNSQNPVELRDLRSNDEIQHQLEIGIRDLGYQYKRQRENGAPAGPQTMSMTTVAESVLAVWRERPHQAKFQRKTFFDSNYRLIFTNLNAAQAVLATIVFRFAEEACGKAAKSKGENFLVYASHYAAMLIGLHLTERLDLHPDQINHRNFQQCLDCFEQFKDAFFEIALRVLQLAIHKLYGERDVSLQQLAATFRRGDLLDYIGSPKKEA